MQSVRPRGSYPTPYASPAMCCKSWLRLPGLCESLHPPSMSPATHPVLFPTALQCFAALPCAVLSWVLSFHSG